jgi:hypothetical protein
MDRKVEEVLARNAIDQKNKILAERYAPWLTSFNGLQHEVEAVGKIAEENATLSESAEDLDPELRAAIQNDLLVTVEMKTCLSRLSELFDELKFHLVFKPDPRYQAIRAEEEKARLEKIWEDRNRRRTIISGETISPLPRPERLRTNLSGGDLHHRPERLYGSRVKNS